MITEMAGGVRIDYWAGGEACGEEFERLGGLFSVVQVDKGCPNVLWTSTCVVWTSITFVHVQLLSTAAALLGIMEEEVCVKLEPLQIEQESGGGKDGETFSFKPTLPPSPYPGPSLLSPFCFPASPPSSPTRPCPRPSFRLRP